VRDELWEMAKAKAKQGSVTQIWSDRCPQGYSFRTFGDPDRKLVDIEGIALVRTKVKEGTARGRNHTHATTPKTSGLDPPGNYANDNPQM